MKRRTFRTIGIVVLVLTLLVGAAQFVLAEDNFPTVVFDASARTFTFENVVYYAYEDGSYPDLFRDIKNAMPGDQFLEQIKVTVINAWDDTVKLYLQAENPNADYQVLMDETLAHPVTLTATFYDLSSKAVSIPTRIRNKLAGVETVASYTDAGFVGDPGVYLGAFTGRSKSRVIDVEFAIPKEAGNEIADLTATVDWIFTAEIIPGLPTPPGGGRPVLNDKEHFAYIIGYPDGLVHPEADITRAEVTTIFFRLLTDGSREYFWCTENAYTDVPSDAWYNNAISTMTNAGLVEGYPDGSFRPNASITRAEFAAIASRFFEIAGNGMPVFSDVDGHWAEEEIAEAAEAGLVEGYPDGTFRPDQAITRAEAMTIVNRTLGRKPHKDYLLEDMIIWPDNMDRTAWYYAHVQEATNSHDYEMAAADHEIWIELRPVRDWAALEKVWTERYYYRSANGT